MSHDLDQTFDEDDRKMMGAFYTPKIWADEAHLEMDKTLGSSWREDCIVWDCCAGSGNLTRDYDFSDLLLSTLQDVEVDVLQAEQGTKALCFKYDFLNAVGATDTIDPFADLPEEARERLRAASAAGKRLVFLINPPYGTSGDITQKGKAKGGMALSSVKTDMVNEGMGKPSNNLYVQFLYQATRVCEAFGFDKRSVGVFAPISYVSSSSYQSFRKYWYPKWEYKGGFMFQASHFEGLSPLWAVTFIKWDQGITDKSELEISIRDIVEVE